MAETLASGEPNLEASADDIDQVAVLVDMLDLFSEQHEEAYIERCKLRAERILQRKWNAVMTLAEKLRHVERVKAAEVRDIIVEQRHSSKRLASVGQP